MLTTIVGYMATVTGTCVMLPQVYKTFKTKSVEDVSWGMLIIYFFNGIFWLTYGILLGATPLMVTNTLALIICTIQITLQVRYSKNSTQS
jgi:MtN3 and saliva related transmembrane protein